MKNNQTECFIVLVECKVALGMRFLVIYISAIIINSC